MDILDGWIYSKVIPIPRGCIGFPKHIYYISLSKMVPWLIALDDIGVPRSGKPSDFLL